MSDHAEVHLVCGRSYLWVGGLILAMEGDPCRDPNLMELAPAARADAVGPELWTADMLRRAAARVNAALTEITP